MGSLFPGFVWSVFWRASLSPDLGNFLPWVYWKCFLCFCHQRFLFPPYSWFVELAFWSVSEYDVIFLLTYLSWSECSNSSSFFSSPQACIPLHLFYWWDFPRRFLFDILKISSISVWTFFISSISLFNSIFISRINFHI